MADCTKTLTDEQKKEWFAALLLMVGRIRVRLVNSGHPAHAAEAAADFALDRGIDLILGDKASSTTPCGFWWWLVRVATNRAVDAHRRPAARQLPPADLPAPPEDVGAAGWDELMGLVEELPAIHRAVVWNLVVEGKTREDVIELLHMPAREFVRVRRQAAGLIREAVRRKSAEK